MPEHDRRAAIYARFSSDKQRIESIEDQVRVCRAYAERHGCEIVHVYADEALSGTSDHRPEFQQMMADAKGQTFDCVLVYKFDRFSRDRYDSAVYKHKLKGYGVRVVSATEYVPETPEGILMESVLEGYAEFYSRQLAQNVLRGMEGNARKCLTNGVRVFGYRRAEDGTYEVEPSEAAIVREVFARYTGGETLSSILADMQARGVRSTKGNAVSRQWIDMLVHNRRYLGEYSWGGVTVPGGMPAIVDADAWEAAQHRGRGRASHPADGGYPLSGKLRDSVTGGLWTGACGTGSSGKVYRYYELSTPEGTVRVPQADMEDACLRAVERALSDRDRLREAAEAAAKASQDDEGMKAARQGLADVDKAQRNILHAVEMGVVPDGTQERIEELRRRRAALEARLKRSEGHFSPDEAMKALSRIGELSSAHEACEKAVAHAVTVRSEGAVVVEIGSPDDPEGRCSSLDTVGGTRDDKSREATLPALLLSLPQCQSLRCDDCLAVLDEARSHTCKDIFQRKPHDTDKFAFIGMCFGLMEPPS